MVHVLVYNLLLAVLHLWFVLIVPEDFELLDWILYSSWNICKTFGSGRSDSMLRITDHATVSISHGCDKVSQTCERYATAEMSVLRELN